MTSCRLRNPRCPHLQFVRGYRDAREAAEARRDAECLGYDTETSQYPPIVTFHTYLVDMTGWSGKHEQPDEQLLEEAV
jgi:hypothetical protein